MRRHRYIIAIALAVFILSLATPALAAYYCDINVTESNGTSYDMLPVLASVDIDYLASNNFIESDGRDVRIRDANGSLVPFMLVTDKVLFAGAIDDNIINKFRMSTGNSLIDDYAIVTGDGGYVTITDHADLELSDDFEIELDGYIDTSQSITYINKTDAFKIESDGASHVTATVYSPDDIEQTTRDANLPLNNGGYVRAGERLDDLSQQTITTVSFWLSKQNSPTGTAYARLRRVSDDEIIGTFGSIDVSTLTVTSTAKDFTDDVYNPTIQDTRFTIEYDGGDGTNRLLVGYMSGNPISNGAFTYYDTSWTDMGNQECTIKIYYDADVSLTATVSAGEHEIKVTGDGTNLKIYEDDVEEDSETQVSVVDNSNDWTLSNLPYINYYNHTTSDTLRITYQPDDIISGTTLINEADAGTHDGTITYGSNPAGIAVSLSGLETYEVSYPTDDADRRDIIAPITAPLFDVNLERLEHNPLRPIVVLIADSINLTERLVWLAIAFIILFVACLYVLIKTEGQISFTAFAGLGICIIAYLIGIFPLWPALVFGIGAVASLVYEKVIAL